MITTIVLVVAIGIALVILAAVLSRGLSNRSGIQRQRRGHDDSTDTTMFSYTTSDQTYDHHHPVDHGGSFSGYEGGQSGGGGATGDFGSSSDAGGSFDSGGGGDSGGGDSGGGGGDGGGGGGSD